MGTTQPIRKQEQLERFMDYYHSVRPSARNEALITVGLYTALRIGDILKLQWRDVFDFRQNCFRSHLDVTEQKTGKETTIALNRHAVKSLYAYKRERRPQPEDYIFSKATTCGIPLCRSQAYRIVKNAAEHTLCGTNIGCHSLRKTFGYHAWKHGTPPALLMDIYNHSSYRVTKHYLGIEQDERDSVFCEIDFSGHTKKKSVIF